MKSHTRQSRFAKLKTVAMIAVAVLMAKVLVSMVTEYRNYFPPNFEAVFLLGREATFQGAYPPAFYTHIIASPIALLIATYLMLSGKWRTHATLHRRLGKVQLGLVLGLVVPSGIVMSIWSFSGPLAGWGFATQAVATGVTIVVAARYAMRRDFASHQRWATYCFILLIAPLLFRIVAGLTIVTDTETIVGYQINAWLSWVIPLALFELRRYRKASRLVSEPTAAEGST
ncbi:DUF2306 domain-containing protein [Bremerella cremea]|uniref:DUF2306 domain-containing protein n=1 Tax=Bremerella cremea TaxID=1031537 RepID=UPI0031EA5CCF